MSHSDYLVQELLMEVDVICYRREVWRRPDGSLAIGELPDDVKGHFGPTLKSYLLYQNHHGCMTQPRIHQQLTEIGFQLSTGQLSQLLTEGHEAFHEEALSVLQAGIDVCDYLQTDDTGARHDGKNGYCTVITNDLFTWFGSTESKSRINFLTLLQAGECRYVLNSEALTYMSGQKFPQKKQEQLKLGQTFTDRDSWHIHLRKVGITNQRHIRIVTEGALLGGLVDLGFDTNIALTSDDAGQFNLFYHALCWIHAERVITKLLPLNDVHTKQQEWVRRVIWDIYADLKRFKADPLLQTEAFKTEILACFDELCRTKTSYMLMNNALSRLAANKTELFRVLERPDIPLHNNLSEREIREYVTRRKISGSTRSENGRRCRDTFTSLKKTCRKLGISFWDYLNDRISGANKLIPLADAIRNAAVANG
ncbi:transposase [Ectothiorhodospiraceae bacterium BW-2]|nr:transposase [Ectothiorhodospiraceae bacterium BW-2]